MQEAELKFNWITIKVKFQKNLKLEDNFVDGYADIRNKKIMIESLLPQHIKKKVLLHEIVHLLMQTHGLIEHYDNETLTDSLAVSILSFLKNNKLKTIEFINSL